MAPSAPVWEYFKKIPSTNKKVAKAQCLKCMVFISNSNGSTGGMLNHLKLVHKINCKRDNDESVLGEQEQNFKKIKEKTLMDFVKRQSLSEIVSRLAAQDGITIRAITNSKFIRQSIVDRGYNLPKSENSVMRLIHTEFENRKEEVIKKLTTIKNDGGKFSITLDEWVSARNRRFININVHGNNGICNNLGLVRATGSCTSAVVLEIVTKHLELFNLSFQNDIVCTTNDGASVMVKYGRDCPSESQLCLCHGLHLAVVETFYKKKVFESNDIDIIEEEEGDEDDDDFQDNEFLDHDDVNEEEFADDEDVDIQKNLQNVRILIKFLKKSSVRNSILQKKIIDEIGHELELQLDVKHRWNSIHPMLEKLLRVRIPIQNTLIELNALHLVSGIDFEKLSSLMNAIKPLTLAVETLGRQNANLLTAKGAMNFLYKKLDECNNDMICSTLKLNIERRMKERENSTIIDTLACLTNNSIKPSKIVLEFASNLFGRLFESSSSISPSSSPEHVDLNTDAPTSLEAELDAAINYVTCENIQKSSLNIKDDFIIFKKTGQRPEKLEKLFEALTTIKPSSTEAERTFSVSSHFCGKLRTRLSDYSLNCLVFLKYLYINEKK